MSVELGRATPPHGNFDAGIGVRLQALPQVHYAQQVEPRAPVSAWRHHCCHCVVAARLTVDVMPL
jgi:hypothetical protein